MTIGDNTTVFVNVKIYRCVVGEVHHPQRHGDRAVMASRFATGPDGGAKIPTIGNVAIEDDVEIGANCAIDRATSAAPSQRKGEVRQPHPHRA